MRKAISALFFSLLLGISPALAQIQPGGGSGGVSLGTNSAPGILQCDASTTNCSGGIISAIGANSVVTLTADTDIAAGTAVSIDSSGNIVQTFAAAPSIANTVTVFPSQSTLTGWAPSTISLSDTTLIAFSSANAGGANGTPGLGAKVLSISGTTITVGSANATGGLTNAVAAAPLDSTHFIYAYQDSSSNLYLQVGSISGTTITLGTAVEVAASSMVQQGSIGIGLTRLSSSAFIFAYLTSSQVYFVSGTVSGTTITLGTPEDTNLGANVAFAVPGASATAPVLIYVDSSQQVNATVGSISAGVITPGTPATITGSKVATGNVINGAFLDTSHFVVVWGSVATDGTAGTTQAAIGSISGTSITFGTQVTILPFWYESVPANNPINFPSVYIGVLSSTAFTVYAGQTTPTIASVSGTTITPTIGGPIQVPFSPGSNNFNSSNANPSGTTLLFPPLIVMGTSSMMWLDGLWNLYEETSAGVISQPIAHPGIQVYGFAAISSTQTLALLIDGANNFTARVITFEPINSTPIGFASSACTATQSCTVTLNGIANGFSGLTAGAHYYIDGDGTLTPGNTGYSAGVALTSSTLLIK